MVEPDQRHRDADHDSTDDGGTHRVGIGALVLSHRAHDARGQATIVGSGRVSVSARKPMRRTATTNGSLIA